MRQHRRCNSRLLLLSRSASGDLSRVLPIEHPRKARQPTVMVSGRVFPYPHNGIAFSAQRTTHPVVAVPVLLYFTSPKGAAGRWQVPRAGWAAVPKAAVDEHRKPAFGKKEIWLAKHTTWMFHPAPNSPANQGLFNGNFCRTISAALDFGHQDRSLSCCERISAAQFPSHFQVLDSQFYRLTLGSSGARYL